MSNKKIANNLAVGFTRWVVLAVMLRLLFIAPNNIADPVLRKLSLGIIIYNLFITFPGKTMRFRLTNTFTAMLDISIIGTLTYFSPIHAHYWSLFFMLPILYSAVDYGIEAAFLTALAAALSQGSAIIAGKYTAGLITHSNEIIPEVGPIVGLLLIYLIFGLTVSQLGSKTDAEKNDNAKMRQMTQQLGATVRFLGVAGEKAQRSAEQLAAAIKLIGTTAYSGVSVQSGMDSIFDQLIKGTVEVLQAERGMIMLINDKENKLILQSSWGSSSNILPEEIMVGQDISGWIAQSGQGLIITKENFPDYLPTSNLSRNIDDCLAVPIKINGRIAGVLSLENKKISTFDSEDMKVADTVAGEAAMVIVNARLYQETLEKKKALERMIKEVQNAQEDERRRIARDLHDGTAQDMAKLALDLGLLKIKLAKAPKKTVSAIENLENNIDLTINDLRSLIYNLRPAGLDKFGLVATLEQYVKKYSAGSGIKVKLKADLSCRLPEEYEINLFRLIQESLTNIKKHAEVKTATVELATLKKQIKLTIKDKGIGFEPDKVDILGSKSQSFGLLGMKERIESLKGKILIDSTIGQGTVIKVRLPLAIRDEALSETG